MTFTSLSFIFIFLPVVVAIYRALSRYASRQVSTIFLVLASLVFYAQAGVGNVLFLAASLLFNYLIGRSIASADRLHSKRFLVLGITANVLFLCYFKYGGSLINGLGAAAGMGPIMAAVGLPLGISFFTIQQIVYLMDIYERLAQPAAFLDHALVISYFPYVGAGPITRARDMLKQQSSEKVSDGARDVALGLMRFAIGLFKKAAIADGLALAANTGFAAPGSLHAVDAWLFCSCYTLQIYFDFSGYTDMAIGASRMLGYVLPENFNNPLRARSISEFWQRWHMTLTNFITNYLYTPLVRSCGRVTTRKAMAATVIAMAIAGVWHGSGLTFLFFGLIHGCALAVNLAWKASKRKLPDWVGVTLTFAVVTLAFVFFRSADLSSAYGMVASVFGGHDFVSADRFQLQPFVVALKDNFGMTAVAFTLAVVTAIWGPSAVQMVKNARLTAGQAFGVAGLMLLSVLFLNSIPNKEFIYAAF